MISATILADSVNTRGDRIATVQYTAHRFILAEVNTHRVFSRNARSSRAVPTARLIDEVRTNPALPVELARNQSGMVAGEALDDHDVRDAVTVWRSAARLAAGEAARLAAIGVHKQWANRVLEPFLYVHGIITSTSWSNFFRLRLAPDAQPEMQALARAIKGAMDGSAPVELADGEWHLPYIEERDVCAHGDDGMALAKLSAARCARVSYRPFDGSDSLDAELARADRLMAVGHWSPFEHQAQADAGDNAPETWRNFRGWCQFRAQVDGQSPG